MKIPNPTFLLHFSSLSLARIVSEDSQRFRIGGTVYVKSSKDS